MRIVKWVSAAPTNKRQRYYTLDGLVVAGPHLFGSYSSSLATALSGEEDIARLKAVLDVPGVHYAKLGEMCDDHIVSVSVKKKKHWRKVHPLLWKLFTDMPPATPTAAQA